MAICSRNTDIVLFFLERGSDVDNRSKKVEHFWETGELDEKTNVSFGEGGAGTFSDGKLNTLVKDKLMWLCPRYSGTGRTGGRTCQNGGNFLAYREIESHL